MDWSTALKVGGPSVVAAFVFTKLISLYLEKSDLLRTSLALNVLVLVGIFIFCCLMGWLWLRSGKKDKSGGVLDNKINDNEVVGNFDVSARGDIKGNEIGRNKVGGDFVVGGKD